MPTLTSNKVVGLVAVAGGVVLVLYGVKKFKS